MKKTEETERMRFIFHSYYHTPIAYEKNDQGYKEQTTFNVIIQGKEEEEKKMIGNNKWRTKTKNKQTNKK